MNLTEVKDFFTTHADFWVCPPDKYSVSIEAEWAKQEGILDVPEEVLTGVALTRSNGEDQITPTVESFLALSGAFSVSKSLLGETPADLMQPVLNHHLSDVEADKGPQFLLTKKNGSATYIAESMVHPFNLSPIGHAEIFSTIAGAMEEQGYVDSADTVTVRILHHTPNLTHALLLLPYVQDGWRTGVHVSFSVSGRTPLVLSMALEHKGDGLPDVLVLDRWTFKHSPKKHGNTKELFVDWVEMTAAILGLEMDNELDAVTSLEGVSVEDDLTKIVQDVFTAVRLPMGLRSIVVDAVEHMDEANGYSLMMCVAQAQHAPGIKAAQSERAQRAAGLVGAVLGARCATCHSLLPEEMEHSH